MNKLFLWIAAASAFVLQSCENTDGIRDEIGSLRDRVIALEAKIGSVNTSIVALHKLMDESTIIVGIKPNAKGYEIELSDGTRLPVILGEKIEALVPVMGIDAEGNWTLYLSGEVVDDGYLRYEPEWEAIYAYSSSDDSGSLITMEEGQLYSAAYGYFNYGEGMEYLWYEDGGHLTEDDEPDPSEDDVPDWNGRLDGDPDSYWSWDSDLCQRNVSEFKGIWYYDGDLSAETYIVIDDSGNWTYYQRAPGAEPAEMDCGVFTYSMDEVSTYYADSTMYDGVSYRVFEVDEDSLAWGDEGVYYLME